MICKVTLYQVSPIILNDISRNRILGCRGKGLLREVHTDVCTVSWELPRSDSTFVPTGSDPCPIVREHFFSKIVSAPEIKQDAMSKRSLTMVTALLLSYFVAATQTASAGGLDDKLPAVDGLVRYGCAVKGPILQVDYADPSGRTRPVWSVTFWAEHGDAFGTKIRKDWRLLYSFRKKRSKGLTDCDKFKARVRKATGEQPGRASGLLAAERNPGNSN